MKPFFVRAVLGILLLALSVGGGVIWSLRPVVLTAATISSEERKMSLDLVNGELLYNAGGCASCHAAPDAEGEAKRLLSGGLELHTPFGTFVVPNISSDPDAGIGAWAAIDFINAMKQGVSPSGQHYYPSFPYGSYQRMPVGDLLDLFAYLKTLPASQNIAPPHRLTFPYSLRFGVGLWKLFYWDGTTFEPDPALDDVTNRGAYLVRGPGHCGECHTPRTWLGGLNQKQWLAGAPDAKGNGFVPNITPHTTGLADWLEEDIAYALESGFDPDFDAFGGSMAAVQANLSQLPLEDLAAMARYLKAIPALPETPRE